MLGVTVSTHSPLPRPATIRTVADRAGVSKSLVSLVLRGSPKVSAEKRKAVQDAIDELGYRPNAIARQLTERRTNMVGVLLNDLRNPWFVDCLDGLTGVLHAAGLRTVLADGRLDRSTDDALLQGFLELRVDGLVLVGAMASSPTIVEAATAVPTVVAASRDISLPHVDVVANDDWVGTGLAMQHLIGLGHTRIAHLAGSLGAVADLRRRSYLDTMRRSGLAEEQVIESSDMTEEGGYRAAIRLLTRPTRPTAIFAVNDITCVGAMSAAQELGLRVPLDVSLVGYDNTSLAQIRHLWLTSVDNASAEVGQIAASSLLRRIADPTAAATEKLLRPSLKIRGSTAAPLP
ncbi:MAG: LacI family DNA-binding transcriptional regulator [Nakamurella sp.]